jgi:hypothetical protein
MKFRSGSNANKIGSVALIVENTKINIELNILQLKLELNLI